MNNEANKHILLNENELEQVSGGKISEPQMVPPTDEVLPQHLLVSTAVPVTGTDLKGNPQD